MKTYEQDDPSALQDLLRLRAFVLQRAVIETALSQARATLEQPSTPEETAALRGEIKGLKLALEAPAVAARQIKEALKRQPAEEA